MKLSIKVVAGSSRNCIVGWLDDTLKVRVRAKREKGRANAAVEVILADVLGISRGNIRISSGMTSSRKLVEIRGLGESEVYDRLAHICS
jgi:uncharacterized protein YggU (UPF0235/DUF167 family)